MYAYTAVPYSWHCLAEIDCAWACEVVGESRHNRAIGLSEVRARGGSQYPWSDARTAILPGHVKPAAQE